MMSQPAKLIAAVQGGSSVEIQTLFQHFIDRWRQSAVIVGVIEECSGEAERICGGGDLIKISDGTRYSIFQDLGPGSTACHLDPAGVVTACESVRREIVAGCDLVVLSKFGKLEVGGSGLTDAFVAALEAEVPVLTSVAPMFQGGWSAFADPYFEMLQPEAGELDRWWQSVAARDLKLAS